MKVIGTDKIASFIRRHEGAKKGLENWLLKARAAKWENAADIKATFSSVDKAGPYHVFDIGRNRFRLVAIVTIKRGTVIIENIMTHAQYDRWCRQQRTR